MVKKNSNTHAVESQCPDAQSRMDISSIPFNENPYFKRAGRSAYELYRLLSDLPPSFNSYSIETDDTYLKALAVSRHASNKADTLLFGLESIGRLIFAATDEECDGIDPCDLRNIACLVRHIAIELQTVGEIRDMVSEAVRNRNERVAKEAR